MRLRKTGIAMGSIEASINTPDWISMAPNRRRSKVREGEEDEGRL